LIHHNTTTFAYFPVVKNAFNFKAKNFKLEASVICYEMKPMKLKSQLNLALSTIK